MVGHYDHLVGEPQLFIETPDFVADPQSLFGDNKFSLRLTDFLWGPPDLHCKPPDFPWRLAPDFSLETSRFSLEP